MTTSTRSPRSSVSTPPLTLSERVLSWGPHLVDGVVHDACVGLLALPQVVVAGRQHQVEVEYHRQPRDARLKVPARRWPAKAASGSLNDLTQSRWQLLRGREAATDQHPEETTHDSPAVFRSTRSLEKASVEPPICVLGAISKRLRADDERSGALVRRCMLPAEGLLA